MNQKSNLHQYSDPLDEHIIECDQRYQDLIRRLESVDRRFDRLEFLLQKIRDQLD